MLRLLLLTATLIIPQAFAAEAAGPPLSSYTAKFEVKVAGIKMGEIKRTLKQHKSGLYELSSEIYTTGFISALRDDRFEEHSLWHWRNGSPVPKRYTYQYTGSSKDDVYEQLDFDWKEMEVKSLHKKKTTTLEIEPGVVDKLSFQIALLRDLRAGKKKFEYKIADRSDIRTLNYAVVGQDVVETPWGKKKTLRVKRITDNKKRVTILWFAPDLDYMIVKLTQNDSGTKMSATITDLHIDGMQIVDAEK